MQRICPYLQYIHDAATAGPPLCLHLSDASSPPIFSKMPGCLENSSLPAHRRDSSRWCALLPLLSSLLLPQSDAERSQGRDFDDAHPGGARGGLDAWRCGVAQERGRSPLHGPVEAVPVRAQIWGCREADDCCGDTATFAVDPAAVIQLQVQVGTTGQTKV